MSAFRDIAWSWGFSDGSGYCAVDYPAETQYGDYLIAALVYGSSTPASGWALLGGQSVGYHSMRTYGRRASGTEGGTVAQMLYGYGQPNTQYWAGMARYHPAIDPNDIDWKLGWGESLHYASYGPIIVGPFDPGDLGDTHLIVGVFAHINCFDSVSLSYPLSSAEWNDRGDLSWFHPYNEQSGLVLVDAVNKTGVVEPVTLAVTDSANHTMSVTTCGFWLNDAEMLEESFLPDEDWTVLHTSGSVG